jgi:hypothetical protein
MHGLLQSPRVRLVAALGLAIALLAVGATRASAFTITTVTTERMSEPGVAVAPDGSIYVDGPEGFLSNLPGSPSPVFRSDNGGSTWTKTPFSLRANLPGGGDSNLAVDPVNGALYMTDLWLVNSTVATSTDKGSKGNGLLYPIHTIAATPLDQTGCLCPPGNLIARAGSGLLGSGDDVGLVYSTSTGGVKFARSTNGGLTFTNADVQPASSADTTTAFPVVADAGSNHLVATWLNVLSGQSTILYSDSHDWGATWSAPRTLVSGGASVYPWIAAKGTKVSISLYHTTTAGTADTVPAGTQWFESYLESTDGGTTFSAPTVVDSTPAKVGPICTGGTSCTANRELGDFQSLTLNNGGLADLTWVHSSNGGASTEVRFAHQ